MTHREQCNAPICKDDNNPKFKDEVLWFAGEEVCTQTPYSKFQKKQLDINKWVAKGKFKNMDEPYTAHQLETRCI
jgi:hypothetical protein